MFGYGPMMGGWGFGMFIPLVIFLAVIFILYMMFNRTLRTKHFDMHSHHEASEILAVRFARGEISEEEYQRLKNLM